MGTLVGHVAPGVGFLLIGLWHLLGNTRLHSLNPNSYTSPPWFAPRWHSLRYLELVLIMAGSAASVAMELFIGPQRHQPLDDDWTIPSNHLHNFEHSSISLSFLLYAAFAIALDRAPSVRPELKPGLTQAVGAVAFAQQLLMFRLHSADHMGVEGQYHHLLQLIIYVSLATTLIGIWRPQSFIVGFVRSSSIAFQGVWFVVMGFALWTPGLIPKGCFMNLEDGHRVVRCRDRGSLERAKALVNIEFSWLLIIMVAFVMVFYLVVGKRFAEGRGSYIALDNREEDLEAQKKVVEESTGGFVNMGKVISFKTLELER